MLKIMVVDDHELVRSATCALLRGEPDFRVIGEASDGLVAVRRAEDDQPDIVVLDVTMPVLGGIEAAVRIRRVAPDARIIFLSQHNLKELARAALATGAHGFVVKSDATTDLIPAIRAAIQGDVFVSKLR